MSVRIPDGAAFTCGTTYMSKIYFDHISETIKARDLIFGTLSYQEHLFFIQQRLVCLELQDLAQILLHTCNAYFLGPVPLGTLSCFKSVSWKSPLSNISVYINDLPDYVENSTVRFSEFADR